MDAGSFHGVRRARFWIAGLLLFALSGCSLTRAHTVWHSGLDSSPVSDGLSQLAPAEASMSAGRSAEEANNPAAVDYYYAAATQLWPSHVAGAVVQGDPGAELYRVAVRRMVDAAVRFNRIDPTRGITLANGQFLPIRYYGFLWQPADFGTLLPVGFYETPEILHRYIGNGVGVEYVVLATNGAGRPFIKNNQPFAATAVLQPVSGPAGGGFTLDFYDPLRISATDTGLLLARDTTAPIAYAATQEGDSWLTGFLDPTATRGSASLRMSEPFQPGKIPIVLVHGLASSPVTWSHLENDLRAHPAIMARYQIWTFRYDTGDPFLTSASELRRQLLGLRQTYDPCRADLSESRMVMVGHSLGGLVSKLQVTYSGDALWQSAAKVPLASIRTDPATRAQLASSFYFSPSPDISCVIYIATPHHGSVYARRCVGLVSSALVKEPPAWTARHEQLVRDNPGAFGEELSRDIPNSIDLLDPSSQILEETSRLPYRDGVALHSIIGDDRWTPSEGANDGVVAVSSARLAGVESEIVVDASHTEILKESETTAEVLRILQEHAIQGP
jgi:pimeloyl-ACP methyl ester carboxylesterase